LELSDQERRLIYTLRKLRFARVVVHVENGCLTVGDVIQKVRFDRSEPVIDFSDQACYTQDS
jgi:hypothetical protein